MNIKELLLDRISTGLKRASIDCCSTWSERYRVMPKPFPGAWSFVHHPWLLEMSDCEAKEIVGQKGAQLGYTEWAMNKSFYAIDIQNVSVLYILPSDDAASDFSADRFDRSLENSPHLSKMFSNVRNVQHKRAGNCSLYVRGSRSRSKLKSIDTALIIFDELDEMKQENLSLAEMRQSGMLITDTQQIKLSTPTTHDTGINILFKESTQDHFFFKCPSCGKLTELSWPESVVITAKDMHDPEVVNSYYICQLCKNKLPNETKNDWLKPVQRGGTARFVPAHSNKDRKGFYVNQMYSDPQISNAGILAQHYLRGLNDPHIETEFWNSRIGVAHAVEGSKLKDHTLRDLKKDYHKGPVDGLITMGIDVGGVCHYEIDKWTIPPVRNPRLDINDEATCQLIDEGRTSGAMNDFNELAGLIDQYQVDFVVIDSEPERRQAYQLATRFWGRVYLCDFLFSQSGRSITMSPEEECTIKVNRTSWFDLAMTRFRNKTIILPRDLSEEYVKHLCVPQRVYKQDKFGNSYGFYESNGPDHLALARVYSEIALVFAPFRGQVQDIYE